MFSMIGEMIDDLILSKQMLVPVRGEISREKVRFSSNSIIAELGIENCSIHNELVEYASEVGNELPMMRLGRVKIATAQ